MSRILLIGLLTSLILAPHALACVVSLPVVRSADGAVVDTLYSGYDYRIQVLVETWFLLAFGGRLHLIHYIFMHGPPPECP